MPIDFTSGSLLHNPQLLDMALRRKDQIANMEFERRQKAAAAALKQREKRESQALKAAEAGILSPEMMRPDGSIDLFALSRAVQQQKAAEQSFATRTAREDETIQDIATAQSIGGPQVSEPLLQGSALGREAGVLDPFSGEQGPATEAAANLRARIQRQATARSLGVIETEQLATAAKTREAQGPVRRVQEINAAIAQEIAKATPASRKNAADLQNYLTKTTTSTTTQRRIPASVIIDLGDREHLLTRVSSQLQAALVRAQTDPTTFASVGFMRRVIQTAAGFVSDLNEGAKEVAGLSQPMQERLAEAADEFGTIAGTGAFTNPNLPGNKFEGTLLAYELARIFKGGTGRVVDRDIQRWEKILDFQSIADSNANVQTRLRKIIPLLKDQELAIRRRRRDLELPERPKITAAKLQAIEDIVAGGATSAP